MSDLEPITRNEMLWSGEDLEPKTRREMYIRHLYDETQVIPDSPKTREEMFILKAGEELHDVTIEQLTATENGTYSEEGVAYSPVIVNVPAPVLDELTVTENGTYTPSSGTDGYNEVNVNVQPTLAMKNITANGTYTASDDNADGYSSVSVNVPLPSNAYLLQTIENESIATFTDGTDNYLKSLEVAIEPIQSGSGDPSPTNIRPISGWSAVDVTKCGKNLFDKTAADTSKGFISGKWINQTGNTFSYGDWNVSEYIRVDGEKIAVSGMTVAAQVPSGRGGYCCYDKYKNVLGGGTYNALTQIITLPTNTEYIRISVWNENKDVCQLELSETATAYEPYNGHTYTIDLDGTRYGGKLDVVNGVLTLTDGFISNYNGETLPSTWISDRDVYAEGTTPTIGAEVCYKLATPQTIQLTPTIIKSLQGGNNFFASTGEIELLQYWGEVS